MMTLRITVPCCSGLADARLVEGGVTMPSILALPRPAQLLSLSAPAPHPSVDPILAPLACGVPLLAPPVLTPPALSPPLPLLASLL